MTADGTFPKSRRLGGRGTFVRIRNTGKRVAAGPLVAWIVSNGKTHPRLGISIGKMVGHAVRRNAIKRQLRECFRTMPPTCEPPTRPATSDSINLAADGCPSVSAAFDIVVQVRPHEPAPAASYRAWWSKLVARLGGRE